MSAPGTGATSVRLPRDGCAAHARREDEDPAGTASTVRRWLVVEHPGPWGRDAVTDTRLSEEARAALERAQHESGARVLLARRHGQRGTDGHRILAGVTTARRRWLQRFEVDDLADLATVDWSPLAARRRLPDAEEVDGPQLLVCTHGRHDPCCAEHGRPLARALSAVEPAATWEASHVGGCRFAANLVVLPEGLYYGHVDAHAGPGIVSAHRTGRLSLAHLRGRSNLPFPVQAAEIALRRSTELDGIDDLEVASRTDQGGDVSVVFTGPHGGRWRVTVRTERDQEPRLLSCHGRPAVPPRYEPEITPLAPWDADGSPTGGSPTGGAPSG
ncbi:sucrase ferredoxin [Egibacter rhizosphaerae]|uniref:sucrase ferredoxin n=1 Tax=Egibacter rhizosphaerae TaxID=1670831 RepID=UPI0013F167F7|nr:sucrase ferredoxin [Egibacter rhizosphaerae]